MNRETGRELSVRTAEVGGRVAARVTESPPPSVQGRSRIVILLHGYNVTLEGARQRYAQFTDILVALHQPPTVSIWEPLVRFHWPGDARPRFLSAASYPFQIKDARKSADRLASFLADLHGPAGGPIQIDIVAHSLGCRTALETLERLLPARARPRVHLGILCLMAAAVQVNMLEPADPLGRALAAPRRQLILHSTGDRVLRFAFPLGQTLAGEGFFPKALGRFRPPPWVPGEKRALDELGHGDYWSSERSVTHVARRLALGVLRSGEFARSLPRHELPQASPRPARSTPVHPLA